MDEEDSIRTIISSPLPISTSTVNKKERRDNKRLSDNNTFESDIPQLKGAGDINIDYIKCQAEVARQRKEILEKFLTDTRESEDNKNERYSFLAHLPPPFLQPSDVSSNLARSECLNEINTIATPKLSVGGDRKKENENNGADDYIKRQEEVTRQRKETFEKLLADKRELDEKLGIRNERYSMLSQLPSRFLRPSDLSANSISTRSERGILSETSTITESDLLETSTPRPSIGGAQSFKFNREEFEKQLEERRKTLLNLVTNIKMKLSNEVASDRQLSDESFPKMDSFNSFNSDNSMAKAQFNVPFESFKSNAESKLLADELSWIKKNELPVDRNLDGCDFSNCSSLGTTSIGAYFQGRSSSVSNLASSPKKKTKPVSLVESGELDKNDSLSVTDIARLLADSATTSTQLEEYFANITRAIGNCYDLEDKENIDSSNITCQSEIPEPIIRSSSGLSQLCNGKLPIESTVQEVAWGCVQLGKTETRSFVIRSKSSSRLRFKISVTNPAFKIKERSQMEFYTSSKIILHAFESRPISVSFTPIVLGAITDKIQFTCTESEQRQIKKQSIKLFAYGGHGSVATGDVIRDTSGNTLLSLGVPIANSDMEKPFTLYNKGILPCFCQLTFENLNQFSSSSVTIEPKKIVLLPEEKKTVTVRYHVDRNHLKSLYSSGTSILKLGKICLVSGTEAIRGRIRRLCKLAAERNIKINKLADELKDPFPHETMPKDLDILRESVSSLQDLLELLTLTEVCIVIEQDIEQTLIETSDTTLMFCSISQDDTVIDLRNQPLKNYSRVEPSSIILTPPTKLEDSILLTGSDKLAYFEINCNEKGLYIWPLCGEILPGEVIAVTVKCQSNVQNNSVFKVRVRFNTEFYTVDVKVLAISTRKF